MSPRVSSSATSPQRNVNTPYARRTPGQPKSSRQQFSACGACRMRRVRCDLKDLPLNVAGPHPACSNCKERNINCIDEFADVKAVKLLRRGRRLQQVEAVYGKIGEANSTAQSTPPPRTANIPILHSDFFISPFWRWFVVQRPVLDPTEFPARFASHCKGTQTLGNEGGLIAMLLVTWAEAFDLNEHGLPHPSPDQSGRSSDSPVLSNNVRTKWKNKTELYLREILELVDCHSLLRRPSLDGLRVLLLLLPLMEEAPDLERSAIHEAMLSQVRALCVQSTPIGFEDAAVRARLFWYAYTQEGIITGLRGNQFVLNEDDLEAFQRALPSPSLGAAPSGLPTPPSTSNAREASAQKAYIHLIRTSSTPLELAKICRKIHTVLTGNRAIRRAEEHGLVDANGMREIWRDLDRCWQELDSMLSSPSEQNNARRLELSQYVHSWQIFIFECHNVIRETLKRFIMTSKTPSPYGDDPSSRPCSSSPYMPPQQLHDGATRRCVSLLPVIIRMLRVRLPKEYEDSACMLRWDAGLVRDGCFYAGYLAATYDSDFLSIPREQATQENGGVHLPVEEAVAVCLEALAAMRWAYSRSDEREETIRSVWEEHKVIGLEQDPSATVSFYDLEYSRPFSITPPTNSVGLSLSNNNNNHLSHNLLRPLTIIPQRAVQSAPNTACSTDGRGLNGWPSYTPPGTATSIATTSTISTALSSTSGGDSPIFANMPPPFKNSAAAAEDLYYPASSGTEIDQFSYNVPLSGSLCDSEVTTTNGTTLGRMSSSYSMRHDSTPSEMQQHPLGTTTPSNNTPVSYMSSSTSNFHATGQSILNEFQSCPQFGENCGPYH